MKGFFFTGGFVSLFKDHAVFLSANFTSERPERYFLTIAAGYTLFLKEFYKNIEVEICEILRIF